MNTPLRHKSRGIALIMVLGLVIFLSVVALAFSESQRTSIQVAGNTLAAAKAQAIADGAVHRMLHALAKPRAPDSQTPSERPWLPNGVVHEWVEGDNQVLVSARLEAAKIDLNFAAEPLLKQVFVSAGATNEEADAIVAATKDWTDADNLKRPNGAEADDYQAAGKKIKPANDFFIAIEELQNVLGVTPKIYNAVAPSLTVHGRSPGIDPGSAPLETFRFVPGLDMAQVEAWVALRDQAARDGLPPPVRPFNSPYFSSGQYVVRVRADVQTTTSKVHASREASVRLGTVQRSLPHFFLWQKGMPVDKLSVPANG